MISSYPPPVWACDELPTLPTTPWWQPDDYDDEPDELVELADEDLEPPSGADVVTHDLAIRIDEGDAS